MSQYIIPPGTGIGTGFILSRTEINTSTYTIDNDDSYLGVTYITGQVDITLTVPSEEGRVIAVKNESDSTRKIILTPQSGTIDGASDYTIKSKRGAVWLFYNGLEWVIL